ncbi:hypothetical protein RGE_18930 [Rubrivivax gelatinosus IL144]|uniref:Uncharacterized protein n=1 Tax=Rubrivivax gelatinosus (strain NBRC 100245 / IL144) TaxID=983917 RepID=I0HQE7_RUBGI|nr:hypothetical protein RGE_18930 [Rubrivivax gelatinosus IL144]
MPAQGRDRQFMRLASGLSRSRADWRSAVSAARRLRTLSRMRLRCIE